MNDFAGLTRGVSRALAGGRRKSGLDKGASLQEISGYWRLKENRQNQGQGSGHGGKSTWIGGEVK